MSEDLATKIAETLGGKAFRGEDHVGGEPNWMVEFERKDGQAEWMMRTPAAAGPIPPGGVTSDCGPSGREAASCGGSWAPR